MKLIMAITTGLIGAAVYLLWQPFQIGGRIEAIGRSAGEQIDQSLYQRTFEFEGLKRVSEAELTALLPVEKSNIWWQANRHELRDSLLGHPLVKSAGVINCRDSKAPVIGCYRLVIAEREPSFVAFLGEKAWVVGEDGALITPLSADNLTEDSIIRKLKKDLPRAVIVKGLSNYNSAPGALRSTLAQLGRISSVVQSESSLHIETIQFVKEGELMIQFRNKPFKVYFEFADSSIETIAEEAGRLKKVLMELNGRHQEIQRVDLVFNKLAVVKFNTPPPGKQESGAKTKQILKH